MGREHDYLDEIFGLRGTVGVITGGAGAIAGALGEALLKAGATVALWGHHRSTIDSAVERLCGVVPGGEKRLFGFEADTVGGNRGKSPLVDQDMETFEFVLRLNLVAGLMVPTKVFGAYWIERGTPAAIVNMTSMASYLPLSGVWAYDAAKAGVLNLTQASAKELAPHGIRVNAIAPGFFVGKQNRALLYDEASGELTPRGQAIVAHTPFGRFGETSELAGALLFLASTRASGFVTGISLPVDGGYLVDNI
jgi:NAD(P)-dependent dehydrogenase (short-subunit alcohol dehydrogenase family)